MFLSIVFLPLLGFFFLCFFGRFFGRFGSFIVGNLVIIFGIVSVFFCFVEVCLGNGLVYCGLGFWLDSFYSKVYLDFFFDGFNLLMVSIVYGISFFVFLYSGSYLSSDPHQVRFFGFLQLFIFFMVFLVCSCNFVQVFFGWEGVGLMSFLLISFWYSRLFAIKAAFKAIIVNKIGDVFLFLGIVLSLFVFGSVNCVFIFALSDYLVSFFYFSIILLCFFVGIWAKSAQLGLHVWLPDAMEGPTPVSALLHAATMVAVGVFFFLRLSLLFSFVSEVLVFSLVIGGLTCFFSGLIGLFQYDIKKIVAYSTCSQLGLMFLGCSIVCVSGVFFHLFLHAFFKALLFLGSGIIIHFFCEEQDLRYMGGGVNFITFVYIFLLVGNLALIGFPFFSGFYSKDYLIEGSFFFFSFDGLFIGLFLCLASILTLLYSLRFLIRCFFGFPNGWWQIYLWFNVKFDWMFVSCLFLVFLSCFSGFLLFDLFLGFGSSVFFYSLVSLKFSEFIFEEFLVSLGFKNLVVFFLLGGFLIGWIGFGILDKIYFIFFNVNVYTWSYFFFCKCCFDELYNYYVSLVGARVYLLISDIDKGVLESVISFGISFFFLRVSQYYVFLQSGNLVHYLYFFLFSYLCFCVLFLLWVLVFILM